MFTKKHLFFFFIIASCLFFSCKKYEDGGTHIYAGMHLINRWTFKQFTVDGADSLSKIDPRFLESKALRVYDASHSSGTMYHTVSPVLQAGDPLVLFNSGLRLMDHKDKLRFSYTALGIRNYPFVLANAEWDILELQKSEVILQMHNYQNDKVYRMVWESGE